MKNAYKVWNGKPEMKRPWESLDVGGKIRDMRVWTDSSGSLHCIFGFLF